MRRLSLACAAALPLFLSAGAFALDAAAPTRTATAEMKPTNAPAPGDAAARSAKSIECSQKADAENLHGKQRKLFMRECKRGG
ncbi:MAG TPA: PsiF family protein [Roseiarcus sp.]|nr:PsiF family protein [Roseiarcus sp.]